VNGPGGGNEGAGGGLCGRRMVSSRHVYCSRRRGGSGSAGSRASQAGINGGACIDETHRASMEFIRVQFFRREWQGAT
jgi:hypothetical protein